MKTNSSSTWFIGAHLGTYDLGANKQAKRMSQDVEPLGARWNPLEVGVVSLFFCFASVFGGLSFHPPQKKNEQLESPKNWWLWKWFFPFPRGLFQVPCWFLGCRFTQWKERATNGHDFFGIFEMNFKSKIDSGWKVFCINRYIHPKLTRNFENHPCWKEHYLPNPHGCVPCYFSVRKATRVQFSKLISCSFQN